MTVGELRRLLGTLPPDADDDPVVFVDREVLRAYDLYPGQGRYDARNRKLVLPGYRRHVYTY